MTAVRIEIDLEDEDRREQLLDSLRRGDDVREVRRDPEGLLLDLAGYERPAAESRAHQLLRTAAIEVDVPPTSVRVLGQGWDFGEDHV